MQEARLIRASRAGYRITERPTATAPRSAGRARGVSRRLVLDSLRDVPRVWLALRAERRRGASAKPEKTELTNANHR